MSAANHDLIRLVEQARKRTYIRKYLFWNGESEFFGVLTIFWANESCRLLKGFNNPILFHKRLALHYFMNSR